VTSGPGILANVTFTVVDLGDSYITLGDATKLKGWNSTVLKTYNIVSDWEPYVFHLLHGYFRNIAEPITHDIAILSVTPSQTWIVTGEPVNVTVVVKNNGTRTEKGITIKFYYVRRSPNWLIETQTISTLEAGANTSLIFTWYETDIWPGTHLVIVVADAVHGEMDTENNALNERVIVDMFYIRSNGSIDPSWAPILSVDNVTYTFTSDIFNVSIVVKRDDAVVDGAGYTLQAKEGWRYHVRGIDLSNRNNVTIKNLEIKGFGDGIRLYSSSNNIISGNNLTNNGEGITLVNSSSNTIFGNNITANREVGIYVTGSSDNNISENNITSNNGGLVLRQSFNSQLIGNIITNCYNGLFLSLSCNNSIHETNVSNNINGIYLGESSNNSFTENNITKIVAHGIWLKDSSNNKFYHNNFLINFHQMFISNSSNNMWDNGYPSGGNYWNDYHHRYPDAQELDSSGIWDTPYVIDENNQDNYPLMNLWTPPVDTKPPTIYILSPENKTYSVSDVPLTFTVSESTSWIGYSLDNQTNETISGNTTLVGLSDGSHTIFVYANDTVGNMGSSNMIHFTIQTTPPDTTAPSILIVSPENKMYTTADIILTCTVDESVSWMAYNLDGQTNTTISGNTTLYGLSDGSHSVVVFAKDTAGNTGASEIVYFSIETQQPEPQPELQLGEPLQLWIIVAVVILGGGVTALVYFLKIRKPTEKVK
jgi:parallel beta-helix repeat protein